VSVESANAASARCGLLRVRVRDFKREHPDFERRVDGHIVPGDAFSFWDDDDLWLFINDAWRSIWAACTTARRRP
jgi:hypothetical protein